MKNNKQFLNFYTDSKAHTTMNTRIANNDKLIKNCIHDLESSQLLAKIETVKSAKNELPTPVYSLTEHARRLMTKCQWNSHIKAAST